MVVVLGVIRSFFSLFDSGGGCGGGGGGGRSGDCGWEFRISVGGDATKDVVRGGERGSGDWGSGGKWDGLCGKTCSGLGVIGIFNSCGGGGGVIVGGRGGSTVTGAKF